MKSSTTKLTIALLLCLCSGTALAAETLRHMTASEPADTETNKKPTIEENLAPGPEDEDQQPHVTITKKGETTVEEYRVGGRLYMIKITPKHGRPYYLIDDRGDGRFARQEGLDSGVRVPMWVIKKF